MPSRKFHMHDGKKGAAVAVRVTPRASRNEIVEILSDDTVKVHITAPPVDGEANEVLLKFLAAVLDVPKSRLDIVAGATGRDKIISVIDMDAQTLHAKIVKQLKK